MQRRDPPAPPYWLAYFAVAACNVVTAAAEQLGVKVLPEPMTMETVGRWAVLADSQGAVFAIFQATSK